MIPLLFLLQLAYWNMPTTDRPQFRQVVLPQPLYSNIAIDSLPPNGSNSKQKGAVRIQELSDPDKKATIKKRKASNKKAAKLAAKAASDSLAPIGPALHPAEELRLLCQAPTHEAPSLVHPDEVQNCAFAFNKVDEFTGLQKRGLHPRLFFTYTPEGYQKFIKDGDFIRCEGFLSAQSEGSMALNIQLYIYSKVAQEKFGSIKPNSSLVLNSLDGKKFYLVTYKGAQPQIVGNSTIYTCSFAINDRDLKQLKNIEIDQATLSFTKGFQRYEVFYLDFLMDQFPCFE